MAQKIARLRYVFDGPGTYYLDLFRGLSAAERKMIPQGQIAHVMGGLIKDSNNESVVRCNVAPDTWVTRTAWRRGKRMFDKMNREATEGMGAGVKKAKYHDIKVFLNDVMTGGQAESIPKDANGNQIPFQTWTYSQFHSEDIDWTNANLLTQANREADSFQAMLVGNHSGTSANWTRVGLIRSWFDSRAEPQIEDPRADTAAVQADPLVNLFDEADASDEVIGSLLDDNNRPPYDEDSHWGVNAAHTSGSHNNLQRVAFAATQAGAGQISAMNGFSAICGLVEVHITQGVGSGEVELLLDVSTKGEKI